MRYVVDMLVELAARRSVGDESAELGVLDDYFAEAWGFEFVI